MSTEYVVNGADLTAIADKIREKVGRTDEILFPDGFTSLIESIASLSPNIKAVSAGTYTATSDQGYAEGNTSIKITHNLGRVPSMAFFVQVSGASATNSLLAEVHVPDKLGNNANNTMYMYKTSTSKGVASKLNNTGPTISDTRVDIWLSSGIYVYTGTTFLWLVISLQE